MCGFNSPAVPPGASQWAEEDNKLCKLGELTVLCCLREGENFGLVGLLRRVDSCLNWTKSILVVLVRLWVDKHG